MATTKITKVQRFNDIINLLDGEVPAYGTTIEVAKEFIGKEIELVTKKNASKSGKLTATQKENEVYKELIVAYLDTQTEGRTCTEIGNAVPELNGFNTSKLSALMRSLIMEGKAEKNTDKKGTSRFTLA